MTWRAHHSRCRRASSLPLPTFPDIETCAEFCQAMFLPHAKMVNAAYLLCLNGLKEPCFTISLEYKGMQSIYLHFCDSALQPIENMICSYHQLLQTWLINSDKQVGKVVWIVLQPGKDCGQAHLSFQVSDILLCVHGLNLEVPSVHFHRCFDWNARQHDKFLHNNLARNMMHPATLRMQILQIAWQWLSHISRILCVKSCSEDQFSMPVDRCWGQNTNKENLGSYRAWCNIPTEEGT